MNNKQHTRTHTHILTPFNSIMNDFFIVYFLQAPRESQQETAELIDQISSFKDEVKNLKDALFYKEEENNQLRNEFHEKLIIDNLEIDNWKG